MNHPDLQQFAQQLALWTELTIDNGRTPFRRVDLYPEIYSAQGTLQPPLVFWINRQSLMAGGILLLPEKDLQKELEIGRRCCAALGLKHFVTWENDRVRIWQVDTLNISVHQEFSLKHVGHPDAFRYLLGDLLEALKFLAVIGMVPAADLSADYLSNLYLTTLDLALPPLTNSYRSQRAENAVAPTEDVDRLAIEANRLVLLQLLTLLWYELLPATILPEKLGWAIDLCLPELESNVQEHLIRRVSPMTPELPHESAVCFHHLLLRLQQLSWDTPADRALKSIQQLITEWYPPSRTEVIAADIYLYPPTMKLNPKAQLVLSDSPALLASAALLEDLAGTAQKTLQFGNSFQLQLPCPSGLTVYGQLTSPEIPNRDERQKYTALLRTSWPNRRFRITSNRPLWHWELIHLLGLCKHQQSLFLTLPEEAFQTSPDDSFWPLFFEQFALHRLQVLANGLLSIELTPGQQAGIEVRVDSPYGTRTFIASDTAGLFRSQVLLAISLPEAIYPLLEQQLNWPEPEPLPERAEIGLHLYAQTRLGQLFQQTIEDGENFNIPVTEQSFWPRPEPSLLQELERAHTNDQATGLDLLLAKLLNNPAVAEIDLSESTREGNLSDRVSDKEIKQEIIDLLQAEGIPTFPDQYLYFLDNPATLTYEITPPLIIKKELLGQFELEDADSKSITVYGNELADALMLSAAIGKHEIELPVDRQQIQFLLEQYRQDLTQLHRYLSSLSHSRLKSSKAARRLTKKVWKSLPLPSLKWLDD